MYTPEEEVGQEGEEGGIEAIDCRKVGQQCKCHACRRQGEGGLAPESILFTGVGVTEWEGRDGKG